MGDVTVRDRFRRWWNPGRWRDEHPEVSDGEPASPDRDPAWLRVRQETDELLAKSALHKGTIR